MNTKPNSNNGKIYDIALDLGIMTTDIATLNPQLMPYAAPAKIFISGLKAIRLQAQALNILGEEQRLLAEGTITREDILSSYNKDMLDALFDLERNETVDEIKFDFLKKIILVGLTKDEKERIRVRHFFRTISQLSSSEILVLTACYHFSTKDQMWKDSSQVENNKNIGNWRQRIAEESGLGLREMVQELEHNLSNKFLLKEASKIDLNGPGDYFGMTEYGFQVLKFVEQYEKF
ncbi:MAG TPA: hypothetical protein VNJ01_00360 [Bacteriovoracaceae bacterium]|nr:hypothetical protein [Bacteriovoracaceae bacterium]